MMPKLPRVPRVPTLAALRRLAGLPPAPRLPRPAPMRPGSPRDPQWAAAPDPTLPGLYSGAIQPAAIEDASWVKPLLKSYEHLYGGDISWRRYWHQVNNGHKRAMLERWDVIRPFGFIHWRLRRDGSRAVDELIVAGVMRNAGVGTKLLGSIGRPVEIHTLPHDDVSAYFCRANSLQPAGYVMANGGKTRHVVWLSR